MWFSFNNYLNFHPAAGNAVEDPVGKPLMKCSMFHLCVCFISVFVIFFATGSFLFNVNVNW